MPSTGLGSNEQAIRKRSPVYLRLELELSPISWVSKGDMKEEKRCV
jgi:hypothetical protein